MDSTSAPAQERAVELRDKSQARLAAQHSILRVLAESTSLAEATPKLLRTVCESVGWEFGAVWRVGRRADVLHCVETWERVPGSNREFEKLTRGEADLKQLRGRVTGAERRRANGPEPDDAGAGDAPEPDPGGAPEQAVRPHSLYRSLRGF